MCNNNSNNNNNNDNNNNNYYYYYNQLYTGSPLKESDIQWGSVDWEKQKEMKTTLF